jgi:outer membrane immunogenic protein
MQNLRKHLLTSAAVMAMSGAAFAADMPMKTAAPVVPAVPYMNWTGGYVGVAVGASHMDSSCTGSSTIDFASNMPCGIQPLGASNGSSVQSDTNVAASVKIGYDWQAPSHSFVYGVIADWTWTGLKDTTSGGGSTVTVPFLQTKVDWLASFRGRMGMALDDTLAYVTGGLALGGVKDQAGTRGTCCGDWTATSNNVRVGWVGGGGIEHKLTQNLSLVGEVLYYDFGHFSKTATTSDGGTSYTTQFQNQVITAELGMNWHW